MNLIDIKPVYEAGYTIFPTILDNELPLTGIVLWIIFIVLSILATVYMIYNIIYNKIKEKRIKERENSKLQLVISQAQVRSELINDKIFKPHIK